MLRIYVVAIIAASVAITSCASDPVVAKKAEWEQACKNHENDLKSFIGKSVWFNPVGQLVDYQEKPDNYPVPFSELKIADVSVKCVPDFIEEPAYQPGAHMYKYLYSDPPNHQLTTFIVSDGVKRWPIAILGPDLALSTQFDLFFYQDPDKRDGVLLPWNPKVRYPKVHWKTVSDLIHREKYRLGISKDELIFLRGHPTEIHTTDVSGNHNEQWVYEGSSDYFYFDNGKLTVIQQ
jgi:hypothetical protein